MSTASRSRKTAALVLGALVFGAAFADDPAAPVERLHGELIETMRHADTLGFAGRLDAITPVIEESFDLEFVARLTMGRYWTSLDEAQRKRFVEVFGALTEATYAARFDGYSGERFETLSVEEARQGRMLVRTLLDTGGGGDDVKLDYLVHRVNGEWRIVNVIANGISELSLKRADYDAIMSAQGFDALLGELQRQVRELESGKSD